LYLQGVIFNTKGTVDPNGTTGAHGNLSRSFVKDDSLQWLLIVIVYGLQERLWVGEDGNAVPGDVSLADK
jgi:hypothetical protein